MTSGRRPASNLLARTLTAVVGIPLLLFVNYEGGRAFLLVIVLAAGIGTWECGRLLSSAGALPLYFINVPAAMALAAIPAVTTRPQSAWIGILVLAFVLTGSFYLSPGIYSSAYPAWVLSLFPPLYCGLLLGHLHLLRHGRDGAWWVVLVLLVTWAYDTGAYFAGSYLGRRPFMQHVSSRKTVEGVAGGLTLSAIAAFVAVPTIGISLWQAPLFGLIAGATAQVGDLIESMLKRQTRTKDSGGIIPGHGGLLDRIDSLLLTGALGYYASALLGHAS